MRNGYVGSAIPYFFTGRRSRVRYSLSLFLCGGRCGCFCNIFKDSHLPFIIPTQHTLYTTFLNKVIQSSQNENMSNNSGSQCVLGDGFKAVLLDVAGTTTSIGFVKVSRFNERKKKFLVMFLRCRYDLEYTGKNP